MSLLLQSRVLKLNKSYTPIDIITAKDAFVDVYTQKSEIVDVEGGTYVSYDFESWAEISELKHELEQFGEFDEWIFTSSLTIQIPRVIRSLSYSKVWREGPRLSRKAIYQRDHNMCQYCGKKLSTKELTLDHVLPLAQGGRTSWTNLVVACFPCNNRKGDKTPDQANMLLIRKPFKPKVDMTLYGHTQHPKYSTWRNFISDVYWNVELID